MNKLTMFFYVAIINFICLGLTNISFAQTDNSSLLNHPFYKFLSENKNNQEAIKAMKNFKDTINLKIIKINEWSTYEKIEKDDYDKLNEYYNQIKAEVDAINTNEIAAMSGFLSDGISYKKVKHNIGEWCINFETVAKPNYEKAQSIYNDKFVPTFKETEDKLGAKIVGEIIVLGELFGKAYKFTKEHWPEIKEALNTFFPNFKPFNKLEEETVGKVFKYYYQENIAKNIALAPWGSIVHPYRPITVESSTDSIEIKDEDIVGFAEVKIKNSNRGNDSNKDRAPIRNNNHTSSKEASTKKLINYSKNLSAGKRYNDRNEKNSFFRWEIKNEEKGKEGLRVYKRGWKFESVSDTSIHDYELKSKLYLGKSSDFKNAKMFLWNINKSKINEEELPAYTANYMYLNENDSVVIGKLKYDVFSSTNSNKVYKESNRRIAIKLPNGYTSNDLFELKLVQIGEVCNVFIDNKLLTQINGKSINTPKAGKIECGFLSLTNITIYSDTDSKSKKRTINPAFERTYQKDPIIVKNLIVSKWSKEANSVADNKNTDEESSKNVKFKNAPGKLKYLIIGVSQYMDTTYNLKYADKDARAVAGMFNKMSPRGENNVEMLYNRKATKANILNKLDEMLSKCNENDFFYFYFSGHGVKDGLVPTDFKGTSSSVLSYEEIINVFNKHTVNLKMMLIDACHSGSVGDKIKGAKAIPGQEYDGFLEQMDKYSKKNAFGALASSASSELSWEEPKLKNSLFTYWLVRGCLYGGADSNDDKFISIDELQDYLDANVSKIQNTQAPLKGIDGRLPIAFKVR
jgi:hypothetical protein